MHPVARLRRIKRDCEDQIAIAEWWAENRSECEPLDCEPERVMLFKANACLAAFGTEAFSALVDDLVAYSNGVTA